MGFIGGCDAVEERFEQEDDQFQHQDRDEGGAAAEAGGGDCDAEGWEVSEAEAEMTEVRVSTEFLRARLFGGLDVWIRSVRQDGEHIFITVVGPDVPLDCPEVMAVFTQRSETVELRPIRNGVSE